MYIILLENDNLNLFNNAHRFLINNDFTLSTSNSFLEILIDDNIYKITEEQQIKNYRKTGIIPDNKYITKYTISTKSDVINTEYDYDTSIKEIVIQYEDILAENITELTKQFQMKKELVYKKDQKSNIYYKCEIITESKQFDKDLTNINFNSKSPKYVYSVVSDDKELDTDYHIRELHYMLDNNIIPLKKSEQKDVFKSYTDLIISMFTKFVKNDVFNNIVMIAPKPATLEKHNLASIEEYGITSIFENYAVTEKADGNRYLLYVDNNSKSFLLETSSKQARGCNIKTNLKNCLLDGELILCQDRLLNKNKDLFAIFDIYYYNGDKISSLPLLSDTKSRYDYMNDFIKTVSNSNSHDITVKKQLTSDNILNDCNTILSNTDEYDYHIDGLIFTPTKIPVFASYANKPVELNNINNFSWNRVFKWKPPEQNTIDFVVIEKGKHKLSSDGKTYKEFSLNVVFSNIDMEPISVNTGLDYIAKKTKPIEKNVYILKQFIIDDIEQSVYIETDINNRCYTKENEEILNNSVIEFSYDNYTTLMAKQKRWKPLRVRHDKNKVYNFGLGEINKTANSYFVAMNIWRSITNEISTDMICGKADINTNIKKYLTGLDTYYKRPIASAHLISGRMNQFHNHIIKEDLYKVVIKKVSSKSLLELACGQGSDLNRWIFNNFTNVLGIDYTLDNITNPKAGAYSRYLNSKLKINNKTILFAAGDCSKPIRNGKAADNIDPESKALLKHIFESPNKNYNFIRNFPKTFNVVSCMFSIHYFFENEDMLDRFIRNVAENLAQNGKFILTFMDKGLVKKILEKDGKAVGKDIESDATIWAIIRKYNIHQSSVYNQKIDVFIENTGRLITENLVDLNTLISKLSKFKIHLIETETFQETFNKKLANLKIEVVNSKIQRQLDILNSLNEDENLKTFSFLNRWCIFERSSDQ
jgi:hypothetical protein